MSKKQAYVYFYASYFDKIHQIYDSDIFQLKIGISDKNNLFASLFHWHPTFHVFCGLPLDNIYTL